VTELAHREPGALERRPEHARQLGRRVKPIIRLGMGVKVEGTRKDGSTYTRPAKTDHFTVRGDERAVAKFKSVYGEQPKAVKIMVPSSLELALEISYRAFIGGQEDGDGRPLALGMTNFAPLGYVGGPDVLRVWSKDGEYLEIETAGLDELGKPLDAAAAEYAIEVHTTFTFTIPEVLGWGSFCQVTTKGKKSADNLAYKLNQIYAAFGSKAPWAFDRAEPPMLVLKPDSALMRFEDDEGARWGKTSIFVLDIVIPEAFEDMRDRLVDFSRQINAAAMYGSPQIGPEPSLGARTPALRPGKRGADTPPANSPDGAVPLPRGEASPASGTTSDGEQSQQADASSPQGSTSQSAAPLGASAPGDEPEPEIAEGQFKAPVPPSEEVKAAEQAAKAHPPSGSHKSMTLREIHEQDAAATKWFRYQLFNAKEPFLSQVWAFAKIFRPDDIAHVEAEHEKEARP
jgi:hypothetical protein